MVVAQTGSMLVFGPINGVTPVKSNIFGLSVKSNFFGTKATSGVYTGDVLTIPQYDALVTIQSQYSTNLAYQNFTSVPNDPLQYNNLISQLTDLNFRSEHLTYLMRIAINSLTGSVNVSNLFSQYAISEIQATTIQTRIDQILSDINVRPSSTATGQFCFTKVMKLAPIFNYYIQLFGMPAYGVGFDTNKLAFLKNICQC